MEYNLTISETGALNLPKEFLTSTGLKPGSHICVTTLGNFWAIRPASQEKSSKKSSILDWEGAFKFENSSTIPTDFDELIQQVVLENDQC